MQVNKMMNSKSKQIIINKNSKMVHKKVFKRTDSPSKPFESDEEYDPNESENVQNKN